MSKVTATISNIERSSTVDGPGIRTVVFLKGCPLKCIWCHNPENISTEVEIMRDLNKCTGCGQCVDLSPDTAEKKCPVHAAVPTGESMSIEQVMQIILRDRIFINTDGGVTFSGGEPLIQADWVGECSKKCREVGIETALDTTLYANWGKIEKLLPYFSLIMVDLKHPDSEKHREYTGVGNESILENLFKLDSKNCRIWLRTPLIPGYNDSIASVRKMLETASRLRHLERYEFLHYNPLARLKYDRLNREFKLKVLISDSESKIRELLSDSKLPVIMADLTGKQEKIKGPLLHGI